MKEKSRERKIYWESLVTKTKYTSLLQSVPNLTPNVIKESKQLDGEAEGRRA
jgi:hypothetical protein